MCYKGTVLAYNKENKQFTVAYDNEGETYDSALMDNLEKGELRIIFFATHNLYFLSLCLCTYYFCKYNNP